MKIIDVLTSAWAILPEKYGEIVSIYHRWEGGVKADISAIEAATGKKMKNEPARWSIVDGVAVIPVEGVLGKRMNLCMEISGGTSTQILAQDFRTALDDPMVAGIVLVIDSPGGAVDGTQDLATVVFGGRATKPVYALADGIMASGAAWIGTSADKVFIANDTTMTGSIGVVTMHTDISKYEEKLGVKTTEIYAGKYKRIASSYEPLSTEGRETLQNMVDDIYTVFVDDVARNRGVTAETVLETMADGKLFIGRKAIDAGLVDGVATLGEVIAMVKSAARTTAVAGTGIQAKEATTTTIKGGGTMEQVTTEMTVETLRRDYPQVADAIYQQGLAAGKSEGAQAECQRIRDVEAQAMPGHETLISTLKFDGKTTGPEAAVQVINAERGRRTTAHEAFIKDAPEPVEPSDDSAQETVSKYAPIEERAKAEWEKSAEIRTAFHDNFDAYLALRRHEDKKKR